MMDKWKKTLHEAVSDQHEGKVLKGVELLLRQNADIYSQDSKAGSGRSWLVWLLPALSIGAIAILLVPKFIEKREGVLPPAPTDVAELSAEMEIALDFELYSDLMEIKNLELLKKLGGSEKWKLKKSKARKS